jgi:diguanylate cyclase (GGDEF)-like protein/PAS domain S-box-containing protein
MSERLKPEPTDSRADAIESLAPGLMALTLPAAFVDSNERYRLVNEAFCTWFDRPRAAIVGIRVTELLGPNVRETIAPHLARALAGETVRYQRSHRSADGSERWTQVDYCPVNESSGQVLGFIGVLQDLQALKELERTTSRQLQQIRTITDSIGVPIGYVDREFIFRFTNDPGKTGLGLREDQMIGRHVAEIFGEDVFREVRQHLERAFEGEAVTYERLARRHGEARWVRSRLIPDFQDGVVVGVFTVVEDINEDRRMREALARSADEIRRFADRIPLPIAYLDREGRYTFINAAFEIGRGMARDQILGRTPAEVLGNEAAEHNLPYRQRALQGETVYFERQVRSADGERRWHRVQLAPDRTPEGDIQGVFVIALDVHEQKLAETALRESERELRTAMESVPFPLAYVDRDLIIRQTNQAYAENMGFTSEELQNRHLGELFGDERVERARPNIERALRGEVVQLETRVFIPRLNTERWYQLRYTPRLSADGSVLGFYTAGTDIDPIKQIEFALRHANDVLESHFDNTPLAVVEWNRKEGLLRWSAQAEKMFGWTAEEVKRIGLARLGMIYQADQENVRDVHLRLFQGQQRRTTTLNRNLRKDGRVIWCEWYNSSLLDEQGEVVSILSLGQDVTARVLAEERLQHLATHDALTGLPNRVQLQDRLRQSIARARRSGLRVCALFIDLDRFKEVNDTLGHRIGDELLREMSVRLGRVVRETDLLVRLSGDEFMVLLEQVSDLDAPRMVAQKLLDEIREPGHIEGHEIYVSASIGISLFPDDGDDAETLLRNADMAMYRAKALGKNTFQMFSSDMAAQGAEMRMLENALRSAIARQELELYFQPVFEIATGRLLGAESLLRWHHPTRGLLTPTTFVQLAEETGLIHEIGNWVLDAAFNQARKWQTTLDAPFLLAINLSASQFRAAHFVDRMKEKLLRSGCDARGIELEVTETSLLQDAEMVGRMLADLRDLGLRIAIDDFGTGYSSLSHLKRFPIDRLKVDRSFVSDILRDPDDAAIVGAVIALGRALQIEVTAEGVEQEGQRQWLADHDCHAMQGYLVGQPLPVAEFEDRFLRP